MEQKQLTQEQAKRLTIDSIYKDNKLQIDAIMNQIEESAKSGWTSQHFEWLSPSEKNYIRLLGYYIEPIHGAYKFVVSWDKTNDKPIADLTPMHREVTNKDPHGPEFV